MNSLSKLSIVAACALTAATAFAGNPGKSMKVDGWISETKCGAAHASVSGANPSCVAKCIREGAKPVFIDDASKQTWTIDNPDSIKSHYGHHIEVMATEDADKKQVHITSVTMLPDQGDKSDTMMSDHK